MNFNTLYTLLATDERNIKLNIMKINELRSGNLINTGKFHIEEMQGVHEYEPSWYKYTHMFKPTCITVELIGKLPKGVIKPAWIEYSHELQNWYYWNYRTELNV